jgi:hypothetical protein
MTVLIVHPGTGTIIDASESYIVILDDDMTDQESEEMTERLECWDSFHMGAGPEGTKVYSVDGVVDHSIRKQIQQ